MSKLKVLFQKQLQLEETLFRTRLNKSFTNEVVHNKQKWLLDNSFFAAEELHEMCRELPYMKFWKTYAKATTNEGLDDMFKKAQKEYVDVVHFLIAVALILNLKPTAYNIPADLEFTIDTVETRCEIIKEASWSITSELSILNTMIRASRTRLTFDSRPLYNTFAEIVNSMLTIAAALHLSPQNIYDLYMEKHAENYSRQDNGY